MAKRNKYSILIFILSGLLWACSSNKQNKVDPQGISNIQDNAKEEYEWYLSKEVVYRATKDSTFQIEKETHFILNAENRIKSKLTLSDFDNTDRKFKNYYETRFLTCQDSVTKITINGSTLWNRKNGTIFIENKCDNIEDRYQFKWKEELNSWVIFNLRRTRYNGKNISRMIWFSYSETGEEVTNLSDKMYTYHDSKLTEVIYRKNSSPKYNLWEDYKKETFKYKRNILTEEIVYFKTNNSAWKKSSSKNIEQVKSKKTITYIEYYEEGNNGYKDLIDLNSKEQEVKLSRSNWNDQSKRFEHLFTRITNWKDTLKMEEIDSYDNPEYYDFYSNICTYDALSRLIKKVKKNKNKEDKYWKQLDSETFEYYKNNPNPIGFKLIDSKGKIKEEVKLKLDENQNPIERHTKYLSKRIDKIKYSDSIKMDMVLVNSDENYTTINLFEKGRYDYIYAPTEKITYRVIDSKNILYKKTEYKYKPTRN